MSDLRDELYPESKRVEKNQNSPVNQAHHKQTMNESEEMEDTKKKVIKIKIKITDIQTRQHEEISNNKNNCNIEDCNDTYPKSIECFEAKTSDTIYMIELLTEPGYSSNKGDCNDNSLIIENEKKNHEHVLRSENYDCDMNKNIDESCEQEYKRGQKGVNDDIENLTKPAIKQINCKNSPVNSVKHKISNELPDKQKNEGGSQDEDEAQATNKHLYENVNTKFRENKLIKYIIENMYKDNFDCGINTNKEESTFPSSQFLNIEEGNKMGNIINEKTCDNKRNKISGKRTSTVVNCTNTAVVGGNSKHCAIEDGHYQSLMEKGTHINPIRSTELPNVSPKYLNNIQEASYNNGSDAAQLTKIDSHKAQKLIDKESQPNNEKVDNTDSCNTRRQKKSPYIPKNVFSNETDKDSALVKDLVMERFEDALNQFRRKSIGRKEAKKWQSFSANKEKMNLEKASVRPNSLDVKKESYNRDFIQLETKTPDSGLDATEDYSNKSNESLRNSDETLKYSPTQFLRDALGDEYMNVTSDYSQHQETAENQNRHSTPMQNSNKQSSIERSIGSSDISTLLSTIDSLYSTVNKNKKRSSVLKKTAVVRPLFSSRNSSNTCVYESLENFKINSKIEELKNEIFIQSEIIAQVSKALDFCRQSPTFFGSISHLEAEKYLLFATHKKEIMESELNRDYEEMESEQCFGVVNVEHLVFYSNLQNIANIRQYRQYYMCLMYSGTTIFATDIVFPSTNGDIIFKKSFQFNNLTSDFEIHIKFYAMKMDSSVYKKKMYRTPTNVYSTWKKEKVNTSHTEESAFQLLGESKLSISDLYKSNTFTLQKISSNDGINHTFTAGLRSSIQLNNNVSGFLTIGTTNVLWNRRWCVLEGSSLKYWNYPNDENIKEPIGILNLADSVNHQVSAADKAICSRPRTITLKIISEQSGLRQYFLQADNILEFEEWKRQLNSVLISLNNWKCLKC